MVTRSDVIGSELLFTDAIAAMGAAEGYLGSVDFLNGLLRLLVSDWTDALGSGTATPDMAKKLVSDVASILIGKRDGFGQVPNWNSEGGIDAWVRSQTGIQESGQAAIEAALVRMLVQATSIVQFADDDDVLPEQWQWQVDAMFEEYVNLFLGIPSEDPDGPEFGPDVPEEPLTEGWVTINTGDDDEGGQRVYIDGSGKMQTGAFKGKTFDQAFGKGKVKAKRDENQSEPPPAESPKPTAPDPKPAAASKPHIAAKDEKELTDQMQKFIKAGFRVSNDGQGTYHIHDPNTNEVKGTLAIGKGTETPKASAGDGKPKLAKPAAFGSMMGGPAKSVNTSLNEMPHTIDAGGVGLMFDIVGPNEHDELAKAIKTVRPDMASAVDAEVADRKASAEKWAKAKAEHDDLMSVHPSLAKPSDLNKTKVKAAFKDVAPDQHDKLIKAISAARPDLADHAAASKPKAKAALPAPPSGLDSFEADKVSQWHKAATEGNLAKFSTASALDGIESDTAKAYHAQLLKAAGVKKGASKSVVVDPAVSTGQPSAAHYASPKKMSDDYDAFIMQAEKNKRLAFDDYDFAKLPAEHQSEFNAVSAFVAGGFTEMNANADLPASKKFKQFLDKLPDDTRHKSIYRVLGFDTPESQAAYIASIAAPHGQPKAFSSWTAFDPTAKGASPMNNIGLDVASQFGDNLVILKYDNPTGAKNLSFAYGDVTDGKTELVLQKGHRFETKSVSKDANGRTVVTLGPPSTVKAKPDYRSKAKVQPLEESDAYPGNKKTVDVYKSLVKGDVDMATLVGAPDNATIKYSRGPYEWDDEGDGKAPPSVVMQGSGPGIKMMTREVTRDPSSGKLVMINHELTTTQPGLGRSILKNQVLAARKAGITEIRTPAAGGPGEGMNGYYTWARYGYDASIESMRKAMPSREKIEKMQFQDTEIGKKAKAKLLAKHNTLDTLESKYKAKSILDVMATQEGRDFWKANGFGFEGTFDLSEGSRSNKVLDAYLAAKGEL